MNTRDTCAINFTGLTHDHHASAARNADEADDEQRAAGELCSAISILKRHPMYDCLILVKKFRSCLGGYSLEFPVDRIRESERIPTNESAKHYEPDAADRRAPAEGRPRAQPSACSRRRLVSRFLDGDDPMYQACCGAAPAADEEAAVAPMAGQSARAEENQENGRVAAGGQSAEPAGAPFMAQHDDLGARCHLVHVPVNGLLDRLENYTRAGVAVDSRVYAFAMGLKTAERMMTTKSMKELQETPI